MASRAPRVSIVPAPGGPVPERRRRSSDPVPTWRRVVATSFTKGGTEEDTGKSKQLTDIVKSGKVTTANGQQKVVIDGVDYKAAAVPMPRSISNPKRMPKDYPAVTAAAMVLSPVSDRSMPISRNAAV